MVLAVNWPPQAPAAGTGDLLERRAGPRPTSCRRECWPTASNTSTTVTSLPLKCARQDRAAIEEHRRHVEAQHRHHHAGQRLVAAGDADQRVIAMAAHGQLDRSRRSPRALTSEDFMPSWPMAMPSVTVMVQNSRGVPPAAFDALLDRLRLAHQRDVAGRRLVPAGGHADEGLVDLLARSAPWRSSRSGAARAPALRSHGGWAASSYRKRALP